MIYKVESKNKNHDKKNLNFPLNSHFQKEICNSNEPEVLLFIWIEDLINIY